MVFVLHSWCKSLRMKVKLPDLFTQPTAINLVPHKRTALMNTGYISLVKHWLHSLAGS